MFNFNIFFKKQKPIPGILGLGGGGTGLSFGGASSPGIFIEYVVIAGGGGGGGVLSGGGGAGGMRTGTDYEVELDVATTVTVGTGGDWNFNPGAPTPGPPLPGNFANNSTYTYGTPGLDSYLGPAPGSGGFGNYPGGITSFGGGGGGPYNPPYGAPYGSTITDYAGPGGSGGGAACSPSVGQGNRPTSGSPANDVPGQGHPGGAGNCFGGGGGGGAGEAGAPHTASPGSGGKAGKGGDGLAVTWPELPSSYGTPGPTPGRWFAGGGGGGGAWSGRADQGDPGVGGAGGAIPDGGAAIYGGGGIASSPPPNANVATMPYDTTGRSGAVIIRFPDSQPYSASGQTFTSAPGTGKTIVLWDSSGSITFNS